MIRKTLLAAAVMAAGSIGVAHAGYIETTFNDGLTTQVVGATTYDFNTGAKPTGYSGAGWILPASVPGMAAAPAGDTTPFLSVAFPASSGTETFSVSPGEKYNYFGLYWGSMDDYNSLKFYNGDELLATITGADVIQSGVALGDQLSSGSNRFVNFTLHELEYDRIVFGTTNFAFESDNHAFAKVPEPGTMALMGAGFAALAFMRRRQRIGVRA